MTAHSESCDGFYDRPGGRDSVCCAGQCVGDGWPQGHDYEPGEDYHPMHSQPMCRICGQSKRSHD